MRDGSSAIGEAALLLARMVCGAAAGCLIRQKMGKCASINVRRTLMVTHYYA